MKHKYKNGGSTKVPEGFRPKAKVKLPAPRRSEDNRPAKPISQSDLDRHARRQGEEAQESRTMKKMAKGGMADKAGRAMKKKSADAMGRAMKKYAKGGSVDGCAKKGKTKGKMVTMARGGKAC